MIIDHRMFLVKFIRIQIMAWVLLFSINEKYLWCLLTAVLFSRTWLLQEVLMFSVIVFSLLTFKYVYWMWVLWCTRVMVLLNVRYDDDDMMDYEICDGISMK